MARSTELRGILAYPVTPLADNGDRIDEARLRRLLDDLIDAGVHALVVLGSTGSIGSFSEHERMRIAEVATEQVNGRRPLVIGTGATTTAEAVRLTRHAQSIGADGVQVVAMSHWPLTPEELHDYYREIAAAVAFPILVHNVPSLTGMDVTPDLMARLGRIDNIRYAKDGDPSRVHTIAMLTEGRTSIVYDNELTGLQGLLAGADAWAPLCANLIPRHCCELYRLIADAHDICGARALFARMYPLLEFVTRKSAVRVIPAAFELLGAPVGGPRRPMQRLGDEDTAELKRLLVEGSVLHPSGERDPAAPPRARARRV